MAACRLLLASALALVPLQSWAQDAFSFVKNPDAVTAAAAASPCAKHSWNGGKQGIAPIGYVKGVALTFAKSFCEMTVPTAATKAMSQPVGNEAKDAIQEYSKRGSTKIPSASALELLESDYGLVLGLGMVESSGRTTISAPFDSANPNPDSQTCEAGLYQTSANSLSSDPSLPLIRQQYLEHQDWCSFDLFTSGKHPHVTPPIGKGDGADFQQFTKGCPSFATEYAAVMLRVKRHHYGTLNIMSAEYAPACVSMFKKIESVADCGR